MMEEPDSAIWSRSCQADEPGRHKSPIHAGPITSYLGWFDALRLMTVGRLAVYVGATVKSAS